MSEKLKIGILFGGKSGEHEVSIVSAMSVAQALDKNRYEVTMIGIDKSGRWMLPDPKHLIEHQKFPRNLKLSLEKTDINLLPYKASKQIIALNSSIQTPQFDLIIPILHGTNGEDGTIQGLLELANIPYVGSGVLGSALGMDKDISKKLFQDAGIPVVPWLLFKKYEFVKNPEKIIEQIERKFGYPYFVKPSNQGSSVGVYKIKSRAEAKEKLQDAFQYGIKIMAEKAISARELEVSVLGNHEPRTSIVGEIIPTHEFYSYEAKYLDENGAHLKIPAENLSQEIVIKLQDYAKRAFLSLDCRGLARVDFFIDKNTDEIYLNEINTIPGFTSISMYPKLWEATGLPYSKLLDELIRLALENHKEKNEIKTSYVEG